MTQTKIRNVEEKLRKLTDRFISTKAIRPDGSFVDSIFDMAKSPGRTMADVWERLLQQMNKTSEYTLVVKFLTFSVFIVNLSTMNPKYRAIYDGFSAADKKYAHLVNILQALCCRLDFRWAGRHLSLVGHLHDLYDTEELGPLGIILLGELGRFTTLKSAENNFNKDKPKFSLQLQVEERSLEILKVLIRRRDRNLTVANPLRVKVAEPDIASPSFTPGDPFPPAFDGTTTDDDQDGDDIDASRFTAYDNVAVQAWFGSYVFTNKSGRLYPDPRSAC